MKSAALSVGRSGIFVGTWRALTSRSTPFWKKAIFVGALMYWALPVDAVPDVVPIVGWLDDVGVLAFAVSQLLKQRDRLPASD